MTTERESGPRTLFVPPGGTTGQLLAKASDNDYDDEWVDPPVIAGEGAGGLDYQGTWNATTNTPTIPAAAPANNGYYYKVATAGSTNIDGTSSWAVGDWIISNGATWDKIANSETVSSVAGRTGAVVLTKTDVGLSSVDNTADTAKPVSVLQQAALDTKQATLVSGTNIKTVAGASLVGSGNVAISKTDVGLGNVDNTSDLAKPISTATQNALDAKAASSHTQAINTVTGLQAALDAKQALLVSATNIKTVNSVSLLGSGNIVISGGHTETTISALASGALAGTLVRGLYADEYGVPYWVYDGYNYAPIAATNHLGLVSTAVMLAYPSPTNGMTADSSDLDIVSGAPVRCVYSSSAGRWMARNSLRMRKSGSGAASTGAQYPTNTRFGFPTGGLSLFSGGEILLKFSKAIGSDTLNSWRLKLGTLGTAADANIIVPTGTPMAAGDGHRVYLIPFYFASSSSVEQDGVSGIANLGVNVTTQTSAPVAAQSLNGGEDTADALYLGLDYTMNTAGTALSTTIALNLHP